ncbi:MAG: hypothetical protein Q9P14_16520 [candidate division KSB1 bacterium]|nr:hypothetical protein [candidate division KSB1 bacterium]MDQ7065043.1 hypothetical protein [candidate division KSB1 bacterium]
MEKTAGIMEWNGKWSKILLPKKYAIGKKFTKSLHKYKRQFLKWQAIFHKSWKNLRLCESANKAFKQR